MYNKYKAKFLSSIIDTDYSPACVRIWTWIDSSCVHWTCSSSSSVQHYCPFYIFFLVYTVCPVYLYVQSICAMLLTVCDFST